jgi:hypothetical protein
MEILVDRYKCTDEAYILAGVFLQQIHLNSQTEKTNQDTSMVESEITKELQWSGNRSRQDQDVSSRIVLMFLQMDQEIKKFCK